MVFGVRDTNIDLNIKKDSKAFIKMNLSNVLSVLSLLLKQYGRKWHNAINYDFMKDFSKVFFLLKLKIIYENLVPLK